MELKPRATIDENALDPVSEAIAQDHAENAPRPDIANVRAIVRGSEMKDGNVNGKLSMCF